MNHTPTPWTNNGDCLTAANGERYLLYFPVDNHARMAQSTNPESAAFGKALLREDGANAAFITRACNAHEALVKAATDLLAYLPASHDGFQVKLEDALIEALQFAGADIKVTTGE